MHSVLISSAGENYDGQIGVNVTVRSSIGVRFHIYDTPQRVLEPGAVTSGWAMVSAGRSHTCAIAAVSRDAYCWGGCLAAPAVWLGMPARSSLCGVPPPSVAGKNGDGQLGSDAGFGLTYPVYLSDLPNPDGNHAKPLLVGGSSNSSAGLTWSVVSAGITYTCAIEATTFAAYCWVG